MTQLLHDDAAPTWSTRPAALERTYRPTLIATAVVLAASSLLQILGDPGDGPAEVAYAQTGLHLVAGLVGMLSFALVAFSVVVVQLCQRGGPKSTVAMAFAFLFAVFAAGGQFADTFVDPFVAQVAPAAFASESGAPPLIAIGFSVAFLGVGLFVGIYGIVLAVMGRVPRIGAILVAVGALAAGAPLDAGNYFALLIAVGFAWMAIAPMPGARGEHVG